jgi:hypothetical protein
VTCGNILVADRPDHDAVLGFEDGDDLAVCEAVFTHRGYVGPDSANLIDGSRRLYLG